MVPLTCSKCNVGWSIHSHDKYCGYCGCKIFDFSVEWAEEPLLYAGDSEELQDLTILVKNSGACPIKFQAIQTQREHAIQFSEKYKKPFQVEPGQQHRIPLQVNPANLVDHPETIAVRTQKPLPNLEGEKSLSLRALPRPDFKLTPSPEVLRYHKDTKKVPLSLQIAVVKSQFYINAIKSASGCIHCVDFPRKCDEKDNAMRQICLEVDCNKLNDGINSEILLFELRGFSQPIEQEIQIRREILPEPPRLAVEKAEVNWTITQDREKTYGLTLRNDGELPLRIENIAIVDLSVSVQLPKVDFPINIEGGEHQNIDVVVSAVDIEPGRSCIDFTVTSNLEEPFHYQVPLTVEELKEYPHYLAIDFGTTNSCCAYIDLKTVKPKLIPLDNKGEPPSIMSSSIVYHSQHKNGKAYSVGNEADHRTSAEDKPYYIQAVKRWLGYRWNRQFPNNMELQPHDVVADILKHIIERAEEHLDSLSTESKITKCVIAHPTMFSPKQQEDLRQAFKKIGITKLILIDEASAATISEIEHLKDQNILQDDYRVLVYDFGGGSIDIVLSQVRFDRNRYTIEPLALSGNPRYGGDDVTHAIIDFVVTECKHRVQQGATNVGFDIEIPYSKSTQILKPPVAPDIKEAIQFNDGIFLSLPEKMKRDLSLKQETEGDFTSLWTVVEKASRHPLESLTGEAVSIKFSDQKLKALIETELNNTFLIIDKMISDNGERLPDTVILAGQSSKMPLVEEMMTTHFQKKYKVDMDIRRAEQPKRCVVIGAAQYALNRIIPGPEIEIDLKRKTHSRIGIVKRSGIKSIFSEIIPTGRLIPNESLASIDLPLKKTTVVDVREHLGTDDELANTSQIGRYTFTFPDDVSPKALREARLQMASKVNGDVEVTAHVGGKEYKLIVEKVKPEFVDEI